MLLLKFMQPSYFIRKVCTVYGVKFYYYFLAGVVEALIHSEKQIDAARFIHSFELTERFPLVPLLKGYLKDLRRNAQGKGGNSGNAEVRLAKLILWLLLIC